MNLISQNIPSHKTKRRKKARNKEDEKVAVEQEKEMKKLETFLFGSIYSAVELGKEDEEEAGDEVVKGSSLFFVDRSASIVQAGNEDNAEFSEEDTKQRKPVWMDLEEEKANINIAKVNRLRKLRKEEDESFISGSEYVLRLRSQHAKLNPRTEWSQLDSQLRKNKYSDEESSDEENGLVVPHGYKDVGAIDDLLRINEDLVVKSSGKLLPGLLEYSTLVDANSEERSNGYYSWKEEVLYSFDLVKAKVDKIGPLVGREEKSLEAFEVSPDSSTIAFVGNEGYILLVSSKTKELIGTLKMNGTVRCLAFSDDGKQLLSSGGDGQVYHWDLRTGTCFHKAVDEGCINGTTLCTSPNGSLFAAGSDSGIVNIYNRNEVLGGKRKRIKTIENLTTKVDFMKFNHDAQILAICSSMKKTSLKLSWWSFHGCGQCCWKVLLYKLHHYRHA
ncbi:hypothetical protein M0R45_036497 [Rubus argutus]|uniref:Uncharacterized protein n=1 Tax=Rubus argutus TaxID=59490 RepID=A0AAW1VZ16_RUBAR